VPKGRYPSALHLGPVPEASAQARRYVREALTAIGAISALDAAELGVSELVTNALVHARTAITVTVSVRDSGRIRIEVTDDSAGRPEARPSTLMQTTGRGLMLLSAYGDWGVTTPLDGRVGKTVWFEPLSAVAPRLVR
jgi:anti-sigma regulatory factor (Ser/Thr protein kinase)